MLLKKKSPVRQEKAGRNKGWGYDTKQEFIYSKAGTE